MGVVVTGRSLEVLQMEGDVMNSRQMHFPLPMGSVILQWPTDITPEWLDLTEEAIALQLRGIRRNAEKIFPAPQDITHAYELEVEPQPK
jgi:hypothetical protein